MGNCLPPIGHAGKSTEAGNRIHFDVFNVVSSRMRRICASINYLVQITDSTHFDCFWCSFRFSACVRSHFFSLTDSNYVHHTRFQFNWFHTIFFRLYTKWTCRAMQLRAYRHFRRQSCIIWQFISSTDETRRVICGRYRQINCVKHLLIWLLCVCRS